MFDDGYREHFDIAFPAIQSRGWRGVEATVVKYFEPGFPGYMSLAEMHSMENAGWEIVAHSYDHSDLTQLSVTAMEGQLYTSRSFLDAQGFNVRSFAIPFGEYNASVLGLNEERGYFSSMRNSDSGYNPMGAFPHSIKVQKIEWNTTLAQVNGWLAETRARKAWLILLFHKIRASCPDQFCVTEENFQKFLTAVQSSALPVVTYEEGLELTKSPR
jgi:peptidoglycan/xylan/chitin deacetylase (PgdA/CDA1 family)